MEIIHLLNNIIPPFVALLLGAIGCICFILLITKPPENKKARTALTAGYAFGFIGFLPLMINIVSG